MNDESRLKTYQITFWINTFEDGNNVQSDSDALIKKWLNDFIQSQAQQDQSLSESKSNFTIIFSGGVDNVEMIRSINADQLKKAVDFWWVVGQTSFKVERESVEVRTEAESALSSGKRIHTLNLLDFQNKFFTSQKSLIRYFKS